MRILLDTNIPNRTAEPGHPMSSLATDAVAILKLSLHEPCLVPQNLFEFWVVCTRPKAVNGLGMSAAEATAELANLQSLFPILEDLPAIRRNWERLVTSTPVLGKKSHDARLVAAMIVHGLTHLVTFNDQDFHRFPMITVVTPLMVVEGYTF